MSQIKGGARLLSKSFIISMASNNFAVTCGGCPTDGFCDHCLARYGCRPYAKLHPPAPQIIIQWTNFPSHPVIPPSRVYPHLQGFNSMTISNGQPQHLMWTPPPNVSISGTVDPQDLHQVDMEIDVFNPSDVDSQNPSSVVTPVDGLPPLPSIGFTPSQASTSAPSHPNTNANLTSEELQAIQRILDRVFPLGYLPDKRILLEAFLTSHAYRNKRKEDNDELGTFIIKRQDGRWQCLAHKCGKEDSKSSGRKRKQSQTNEPKELERRDRTIDHFRTHIEFRPHLCGGNDGCGTINW